MFPNFHGGWVGLKLTAVVVGSYTCLFHAHTCTHTHTHAHTHMHTYTYTHTHTRTHTHTHDAHTQTKYLEVSRVLQMGERLVTAYHYASDMIRGKNIELRCTWEVFSSMVDDRSALLALSVVFHDGQQKVLSVSLSVCFFVRKCPMI